MWTAWKKHGISEKGRRHPREQSLGRDSKRFDMF
jgi:hypothetical protein